MLSLKGSLLEPKGKSCMRVGGRTPTQCDLQELLSLLRPSLQRFTTLEEACSAAAALEAQEEGGLEVIEEVPSEEEDGESGSEMGHDGRGRLCNDALFHLDGASLQHNEILHMPQLVAESFSLCELL